MNELDDTGITKNAKHLIFKPLKEKEVSSTKARGFIVSVNLSRYKKCSEKYSSLFQSSRTEYLQSIILFSVSDFNSQDFN